MGLSLESKSRELQMTSFSLVLVGWKKRIDLNSRQKFLAKS